MIKKLVLTAFVILAGLLSAVTHAGLFDSEPEFLPRDQAFVFDFEQQGDKLVLKWQIEDGYYLYRHQLKFNSDVATLGEPVIPEGKDHYDEYFGQQQVYYQELEVSLPVLAAAGDAEVIVGYQGCADCRALLSTDQENRLCRCRADQGRPGRSGACREQW